MKKVEGKRIAFLGGISHKKGIQLLIEGFHAIYKEDREFTLSIGGAIQDVRYGAYLDHSIRDLGLQDNIYYAGRVDDVVTWLSDKDFIICSSPLEGCPVGLLESMAVGLKPLIHSFVGAKDLYPPEYIWKTIPDLVKMVKAGRGNPEEYRNFVKENYSLDKQLRTVMGVVGELAASVKPTVRTGGESTVSAVIAVKNGEKVIGGAIDSLVKQTKKLDKIFVVDDGSTDDTKSIVEEFKFRSDWGIPIEIVTIPASLWVYGARNKGVASVDSDYFFFLDADDRVQPNYVEEMCKMLDNNPQVSVVYPRMTHFSDIEEESFNEPSIPEFNPQLLIQHNFVAYSSMQRTEEFQKLGGYAMHLNDSWNHLTEWDLWMRYLKGGHGFKKCNHTNFLYYVAPSDDDSSKMSDNYERPRLDMHVQMAMGLVDDISAIDIKEDADSILLVCQARDYVDRSKAGFELLTWCKPLQEFGDVYVFPYDVLFNHFGIDGLKQKLQDLLYITQPKYIFHPSYRDDIISGQIWNAISKQFTTIVWHSDDDRRFESFSKKYGMNFTHSVTTYPEVFAKMSHPGRILSSWAANTHYFYPRDKDIDVSFCGQKYGDREEILKGLPVEIYGGGWGSNSFLDYHKMAEIIGKSKISINFSKGGDGKPQVKLRPFEIGASSTLCLCERVAGFEQFYVDGDEIIFFDNKNDLKEKIEYYLAHDEERVKIAKAAYRRTMLRHTWGERFKKIFEIVDSKR